MNKTEAYKLLSDELESVHNLGIDAAKEMLSATTEFTKKSQSGASYCITMKISDNTLIGSIHDYDTFGFELLEESLEF